MKVKVEVCSLCRRILQHPSGNVVNEFYSLHFTFSHGDVSGDRYVGDNQRTLHGLVCKECFSLFYPLLKHAAILMEERGNANVNEGEEKLKIDQPQIDVAQVPQKFISITPEDERFPPEDYPNDFDDPGRL